MKLLQAWRQARRQRSGYQPLIEIQISRSRLLANWRAYQNRYPDFGLAPVLKSNAYGHDLVMVAEILDQESPAFFVVDSWPEAQSLRRAGIKSPILIIGYVRPENIKASRLSNLAFTVTSLEQLRELSLISSRLTIHLKIDTGMRRQGLEVDQVDEALEILRAKPNLSLEGLCSHLADADNKNPEFTREQLAAWSKILARFETEFPHIKYKHLAASAGAVYAGEAPGNVLRLGLGLYGINSSPLSDIKLQPVLEMRAPISSVRPLLAGEGIGYNLSYRAEKNLTVATVPAGYYEGVDRRLSNSGFFKIGSTFCPIVGRVSMNISSLDVSAVPAAQVGDSVVIISREEPDPNSAANIAKQIGAIPYEVLVHIPGALRRTLVD
jgi:alanine racemase